MENLDAMTCEELHRFLYSEMTERRQALKWFPTRPRGYTKAAHPIRMYGISKLRAMRLRVAGDIKAALGWEDECQRIYDRLPEYARW